MVLGKWFAAKCKLLVLDEPTVGIDVGARQDIYGFDSAVPAGAGTRGDPISSDIDEVLEIADRILVLADLSRRRRAGSGPDR